MKTTLMEQVQTRRIEMEIMESIATALDRYKECWLKTWDADLQAYRDYTEDEKDEDVKIRENVIAAFEDKLMKMI